jgi:hypothetical protein
VADSTYIRSSLQSLMQDFLSDRLVSTLVNTMPLMYFLLGKDGNKDGVYGLGVPKTGAVFSGVPMSKARKQEILGTDTFMPIVQTSLPNESDGKVLTNYDTMPVRANAATAGNTAGTRYTRPFFRWTERADPILVWNKEIRRTRRQNGGGGPRASAAVGDLFTSEERNVLTTHLQWWNKRLWYRNEAGEVAGINGGFPTNVDDKTWDNPYSIRQACLNNNVYGGVDRSLAANSWWQGNVVTAHRAAVLSEIVDEANYALGCAALGKTIDLWVVGSKLFPIFAAEARSKGGQIIYANGQLPGYGKYGFTRQVVQFNNAFVLFDPLCPTAGVGGATKNCMAGLNLDTWMVSVSPDANFSIDEPFNLAKTEGGKDAMKSQLRTELMIACESPKVNVWYDDVG